MRVKLAEKKNLLGNSPIKRKVRKERNKLWSIQIC